MKRALIQTLSEYFEKQENAYLLIGDLGYGVIDPLKKNWPNRVINMGICEQNMASVASGMAIEGNIVFTYSIGNFPTLRCIEQIRNDIAYHRANVKIVSVGAGFSYGNLGMSHHALEDISMMRSIPGMAVISPADPNETVEAVKFAFENDGPVYIRLGRGGEANIQQKTGFDGNKMIEICRGMSIAILSTGLITKEAVKTAEKLAENGITPSVYSVPVIKPLDTESLREIVNRYSLIVTLEEHTKEGGFGGAISEVVTGYSRNATVLRIGMDNAFPSVVGSPDYLRKHYRLDCEGITQSILHFIGKDN